MKKLLTIVFLLSGSVTFAQHFQPGLKAGVNISDFYGGNFSDVQKKAIVGYHAGGFISLFFGKHFAIQPEALISTAGAKLGESDEYKITYATIPVMLKYKFSKGLFIEAGPQVGFKISESVPNQTIDNFAKSADLSVAGGLGYHGKSGLGIGARYVAGLSKVGDFDPSIANPDFKNGIIQISLFYTLFNKK